MNSRFNWFLLFVALATFIIVLVSQWRDTPAIDDVVHPTLSQPKAPVVSIEAGKVADGYQTADTKSASRSVTQEADATLVFIVFGTNAAIDGEVRLTDNQGQHPMRSAQFSQTGEAVFSGVAPGYYSFNVNLDDIQTPLNAAALIHLDPGEYRTIELELPIGGSKITGAIIDDDGNPVSGLTLRAERVSAPSALLLDRIDLSATSRDDGRFALNEVSTGTYELRVESNQYVSSSLSVRAPAEGVILQVAKKKTWQITGRVTDMQGFPVASANVYPPAGSSAGVQTNTEGYYSLMAEQVAADRQYLRFTSPGYLEHRLRLDHQTDTALTLDIELTPITDTVTLSGKVVDTTGRNVAKQALSLYSPSLYTNLRAVSDADGGFMITDIPAGSDYVLSVRPKRTYRDFTMNQLSLTQNESIVLTLQRLEMVTISGRVIDDNLTPVAGYRLWVRSSQNEGKRRHIVTDQYGGFSIDIPAGLLTIGSQLGLLSNDINVEPGQSRFIELQI